MLNCQFGWRDYCKCLAMMLFTLLDLPQQNATTDSEINAISIEQERIVVTKDRDFLDSFLLRQQPYKLLHSYPRPNASLYPPEFNADCPSGRQKSKRCWGYFYSSDGRPLPAYSTIKSPSALSRFLGGV
jgi:hypothetical protein